jgi:tetratricopeptide (TPR) repeat protein
MNETKPNGAASAKPLGKKTTCYSCGMVVAETDERCPHCGSDLKNPTLEETSEPLGATAPKAVTPPKKSKQKKLGAVKQEQLILFSAAAMLLATLSVFGYQGMTSGKKGFDLSGAAGAGAQPLNESTPPAQNPAVNSRAPQPLIADKATIDKLAALQQQHDAEKDNAKKQKLALALVDEYIGLQRLDRAGFYAKSAYEASGRKDQKLLLKAANLYDDAQEFQAAAELYEMFLAQQPKNTDARVDYAICLLRLNKPQDGVAQMRQAVEDNPKHQKANLNLGILYGQIGRIDEARNLWKTAQAIDPSNEAGKKAAELLEQFNGQ